MVRQFNDIRVGDVFEQILSEAGDDEAIYLLSNDVSQ